MADSEVWFSQPNQHLLYLVGRQKERGEAVEEEMRSKILLPSTHSALLLNCNLLTWPLDAQY